MRGAFRDVLLRVHGHWTTREGGLRPTLTMAEATDLLYVITSLRMWEDLVRVRGWTADEYQERVTRLLLEGLSAASR